MFFMRFKIFEDIKKLTILISHVDMPKYLAGHNLKNLNCPKFERAKYKELTLQFKIFGVALLELRF